MNHDSTKGKARSQNCKTYLTDSCISGPKFDSPLDRVQHVIPKLYHTNVIPGALHMFYLIRRGRGLEASGIGGMSKALCNTG